MRQPGFFPTGAWSMRRSRHQRNAVRVLPVPVGARMRALSRRAMTGQPRRCGAVGASKTARNHSAVTGWKQAKGSASTRAGSVAGGSAAVPCPPVLESESDSRMRHPGSAASDLRGRLDILSFEHNAKCGEEEAKDTAFNSQVRASHFLVFLLRLSIRQCVIDRRLRVLLKGCSAPPKIILEFGRPYEACELRAPFPGLRSACPGLFFTAPSGSELRMWHRRILISIGGPKAHGHSGFQLRKDGVAIGEVAHG